jgi:hypothetical protein
MSKTQWLRLITTAVNDNAPHDPRDYENFDPSDWRVPDDVFYEDDTPLDVVAFMTLIA